MKRRVIKEEIELGAEPDPVREMTEGERNVLDMISRRKARKKAKFLDEQANPDLKEVKVFPKQKCRIQGCNHNAVGEGDLCRRHGGDGLVEENLLPAELTPDALVEKMQYRPEFHPMEFIRMASEGSGPAEIAAEFGVSVAQLTKWAETFEPFNLAYEVGAAQYEAWWQRQGKENLGNFRYNTGLFKFLTMQNLGWSEKSQSRNLNVNAGVLLAPKKLNEEEFNKEYAHLQDS